MKKIIFFTFFLFINIISFSQKRILISKNPDNGKYIDGNSFSYKPGDTLVLDAAQNPFTYFAIGNFHGSKGKSVVIINKNGRVNMINGMALSNCTFVKITGTGSEDKYGFKIEDPSWNGVGIDVEGRSSDIEISNIYIHNKTYGFWVKQEASCADSLQHPNWIINNISIHDNLIVKMGQEGMYLGSTNPNGGRQITCNGVVMMPIPLRLGAIKVYKNIIDSTWRSGIQLSGASTGDNEIYGNIIMNAGFEFNAIQGNGISLGGFSHAHIFDNIINNTFALGILMLGSGHTIIEHNHIDSSGHLAGKIANGMAGIMIDTRPTVPIENTLVEIKNNFIGTNTDYAIRFYQTYATYAKGNLVTGNTGTVKAAPGIDWSDGKH